MSSSALYRLVYVSRATFKPFDLGIDSGLDGNVVKILNQSRRNNQKRNLVGALYYGGGCFFQCLEGRKEDIDALYAILLQDPRHKDLKILSSTAIEKIGFTSWEMKYATIDQEIRVFLRKYAMSKFDPYRFTTEMIDELVNTLQQAQDDISTAALEAIAKNISPPSVSNADSSVQLTKILVVTLIGLIILVAVLFM